MRRTITAAAMLLAMASAAHAEGSGAAKARVAPGHAGAATVKASVVQHDPHEPQPGRDSTIRSMPYNPSVTIYLTSTDLSPIELVLAPGEHRSLVAGARVSEETKTATDWYVRDHENVVIFQPLKQMAPSMAFLETTTGESGSRHYTIMLKTRAGDIADTTDPLNYSEVDIVYPHTVTPAEVAAWKVRREAAGERAVKARLVQDQFTAPRNRDYSPQDPKGCPSIAPKDVSDDTHFTTLLFSPGQVLPNVFWYEAATKAEHKLSPDPETTQAGVLLTVTGVYRELRLRSDNLVCALHNNAYRLPGTMPGNNSGTSSPAVFREVRGP